jgi:hypothetical protein
MTHSPYNKVFGLALVCNLEVVKGSPALTCPRLWSIAISINAKLSEKAAKNFLPLCQRCGKFVRRLPLGATKSALHVMLEAAITPVSSPLILLAKQRVESVELLPSQRISL